MPFGIQREMAALLAKARRERWIDAVEASALNATLGSLTDAQGGLERIRNTPMPQQYAAFSRAFVTAYCLLLPFGIVPDLNLLTPFGSAIIGLVFLALDESGRHLEDPFAGLDLRRSHGGHHTHDRDRPQAGSWRGRRARALAPVDGILR